MNPNPTLQSFTYKDLLLKKLSYAVTSSVISQFFIVYIYVCLTNFNLLHPVEWIVGSTKTMVSFSTWIFMLPFMLVIFGQSLICAKDYVFKSTYCSTRFQKFVATFSVHNLVLSTLHVLVGGALIWKFLSISGGQYENLTYQCRGVAYCLNEGKFFLILSGIWTGFYFFVKIYIAEKNLAFPVIHQRKFLQLKSQLGGLMQESITQSMWPCLYFAIFYWINGRMLEESFRGLLGLLPQQTTSVFVYFHLWFFSSLYYFNMNLMRFFFNLFLTEPVQFPLLKDNTDSLNLQDSMTNYDWPIVQNLACLDLFLLSEWSPVRRGVFFTLSNPGHHPHNWNCLIQNVLKLINEYTQLLNRTIEPNNKPLSPKLQPNIQIKSPIRFRNMRNMTFMDNQEDFTYDVNKSPMEALKFGLMDKIRQKIQSCLAFFRVILGINFLFGELPQANVRKCLANGNLIIWTSQGISNIIVASLTEDQFGICQKDLPAVLTSLVNLKQSLDKLNKVPALTRKMVGYDDFNYRMKGAVTSAVKRSLFNICKSFSGYLDDIPLGKDVQQYLQVQVLCKS